MSEWISVEDRLPDADTHLIICYDDGLVGTAFFCNHLFQRDWKSNFNDVTYWQPLPDPPESATSEECNHEWVSADNEIVSGCIICIKCKEIRAASSEKINQS